MNIVLFGHKYSGKTYYGKSLAQALDLEYTDTDVLIEELFWQKFGIVSSCREIFETRGETIFRTLEREVIDVAVVKRHGVLTAGAGAILDPHNQNSFQSFGRLVYLRLDRDVLKQRICENIPAFLNPSNLEAAFEQMYAMRTKIYESIPADAIDVTSKTDEEVLDQFKELLIGK